MQYERDLSTAQNFSQSSRSQELLSAHLERASVMCAWRQRGKNPQFYDRIGSASEEDTAIALFELQCMCLFLLEFQFYFRQARLILACLQKLEMHGHVFVRCGTSRINFIAYTLMKGCCRSSG